MRELPLSHRLPSASKPAGLPLPSLADGVSRDDGEPPPPMRAKLLPTLLMASLAVGELPRSSPSVPPAVATRAGAGDGSPVHLPDCCLLLTPSFGCPSACARLSGALPPVTCDALQTQRVRAELVSRWTLPKYSDVDNI